jgi:hypothetical protein
MNQAHSREARRFEATQRSKRVITSRLATLDTSFAVFPDLETLGSEHIALALAASRYSSADEAATTRL